MTIQHIPTFAFMSLAISAAVSQCVARNSDVQLDRPRRDQCIVEVVINRPEKINLNWFTDLRREAHASNIPLAAFRIRKPASIYLQFQSDCDRRQDLSRELMLGYVEKHSLKVNFEVSEKIVSPSTTTIDVAGPYWRE